jgi:hypothetical protein
MTQNTTKIQNFFKTKVCLALTVFILFWYCMTTVCAAPERDLNLAIAGIAGEVIAELPKDSGEAGIALIPLNATEPDLKTVSRVLTSLLASQLAGAIGEALIGSERLDWRQYPTDGSLLTPEQVKGYGKSLACQWLITGRITKLDLVVNLNLFLWDVKTGYLRYVANRQLSPVAALVGLYTTAPDANFQPYFLKWQSLPEVDYFALAIEVSDPDGDGFNEVIVADEKHVKVLKRRWF